ncbi:DEAD/DEAH box helicase [Crocinitomicaceae bacterium CZZ-1]|uniref:DEAD-box ATP-dependent RNA helicase RhpA n=1 Tax=Taishania pollutisoli TaxID=2766479 RepID=A0A8J6PD84_9FLAO|nr:DEAD/DEAH box helicase [Taishania pollutisoli]MBC9812987.1 DEAD/DEAH box helicase [Taishania pollutisoli]MBX2948721.1 DEAD/DEAH box helicase [Crocinitomicaceae bacterium]
MTFEELGLKSGVLKSLTEMGFETPTPIQTEAIPHLLKEESDFVGLAQTGTGKTAAFGLPLVSKVEEGRKIPQGLVICPTRELCLQITKDLQNFSKHLKINVVAVYGGTDIRRQMTDIKNGATIVVATPGRLVDLANRKALRLEEVEWVVLDEADEMLNMGFKEDIDTILEQTPDWKNVWLFSATMPKEVAEIAKNYMTNPLEVSIGHKNQTNENIEHIYFMVKEKDRYAATKRLIDFNPSIYGLIFCRTRRETAQVAEMLEKDGYNAAPLHGDLSQAQRDSVMKRFREKSLQILVATDVAARGIDVSDVTHVINYNLPDDIENYTHRSGRTARAGKKGESLVLINTRELGKIRQIERTIRTTFTVGTVPNAKEICEIQLLKLADKVISTEVKEDEIEEFLPIIMREFDGLSKEEVVKKFISAEFNRFIDYYERAGDLNASTSRDRGDRDDFNEDRGSRNRDRGSRRDEGKTRFFVSLGKRDGLNPGGLLRVICDSTGLRSENIGKIDILASFSFFEADDELADKILSNVNGTEYEGHKVSVEITKNKSEGSSRGRSGGGRFDGGNKRSGGFGGGRRDGDRGGRRDSDRGGFRGRDKGSDRGGFKGKSDSDRSSGNSGGRRRRNSY